jgi:hypothetical protein
MFKNITSNNQKRLFSRLKCRWVDIEMEKWCADWTALKWLKEE